MYRTFRTMAFAVAVTAVAGAAQAGDFDGGYVGVYGSNDFAAASPMDVAVGAYAGVNVEMGSGVVVGAEVDANYDWNSSWGGAVSTGTASARVGYVVSDSVMVYGKAGGGYSTAAGGTTLWDAGAGAEMMVTDSMAMRAEVEMLDPTAAALATKVNLKVGAGYNF